MDKRGQALGWGGLVGAGGASVAMNIRSLWIPAHVSEGWRALPEIAPDDFGAILMAVFLPLAALVGVEMVNHWTHLHKALRFGVLGLVAFSALASSFVHVVTVFMWYGQPLLLAILGTIAVDGIMILSGLALFTKDKRVVQPDSGQVVPVSEIADTIADMVADIPLSTDTDTDTAPDTVPDMDTLPVAPVDIIRQRRPRADASWKADATEMIRNGDPSTDQGIADKILANEPGTWSTPEAGRKAVSRLRAGL